MRSRRGPSTPRRHTGPAAVSRRALLAGGAATLIGGLAAGDSYIGRRRKDQPMDDLSSLLIAHPSTPARPMMYRQGIVQSWNADTAENVVTVDGSDFVNLPCLNTSEARLLGPGAVVGIVDVGNTWAVLGRFTIPGTADAASIMDLFNFATADVNSGEATTSSTPTDLTTVGPSVNVNIGLTGRCFVTLTAWMTWGATTATVGEMTFAASGAGTILVNSSRSLRAGWASTGGGEFQGSRRLLLTGLTPGNYTFTSKYAQRGNAGNSVSFAARNITVEPY